jgi:hypothetical protein
MFFVKVDDRLGVRPRAESMSARLEGRPMLSVVEDLAIG